MSLAVRSRVEPAEPNALPTDRVHRFTVEQYHRMIETGVLREHDRVILLDGLIVTKMTHNPPHDVAVDLTQGEVATRLPRDWRVRVQSAVTLTESEPEPDIAVVRGPARRYRKAHPGPRDIGLLIEIADSSLAEDRTVTGPLYAKAKVPVYWIVNLVERKVEVYSQPRAGRSPAYVERRDYAASESVPLVLENRLLGHIPVQDLLP